nr:hypothetical protein Itr_chr08CG11010 [Ipomoea trifida]
MCESVWAAGLGGDFPCTPPHLYELTTNYGSEHVGATANFGAAASSCALGTRTRTRTRKLLS